MKTTIEIWKNITKQGKKANKPLELTWGYWAALESIGFNNNFLIAEFVGIKAQAIQLNVSANFQLLPSVITHTTP